ncbi:MAG: calcium/sodium antiporter [Bacteroidales bacterium]|nr:calcium/sodium antiporter [Bacteroidales bacterium]
MPILVEILLLIAGLILVVLGADALVDGASSVAKRLGVSEFVIGLVIVGFGTSCPELVVSLTGAFKGNADISVGNVVGSNIFNTLLILGLTAVVAPVAVTSSNSRKDIPLALLISFLFVFLAVQGDGISRFEGILFLLLFIAYIIFSFKSSKASSAQDDSEQTRTRGLGVSILMILLGLAGLIIGGQLFVDNACSLARELGVSDKIIAITLLAGGTSLPELATCIVAAAKHKDQLALGNILGSNVFNILLILGCSAVVTPLSTISMNFVDFGVLLLSAILIWLFTYTGTRNRIDRWEGALLVASFIAYFAYLFIQ